MCTSAHRSTAGAVRDMATQPARSYWRMRNESLARLLGARTHSIALAQQGLLNHEQLQNAGISPYRIYRRSMAGEWSRVTRGVYNVMPEHSWPDRFAAVRLQAAWTGLLAVRNSIATGSCALALHGVWGLPLQIKPEVAGEEGISLQGPKGVRVRRYRNFPTVTKHGRLLATPVAALVQALPEMSRDTAVSTLDSAGNLGLITPEDLEALDCALAGRRGSRRVRAWLPLVDFRAHSPFESRARLQCHDTDLPAPDLQVEIFDGHGNRVARGDLGWQRTDGTWLLVDFDGRKYHEAPDALLVDRWRQNAIAMTARHTHLRFAWEDLRTGEIPQIIARALERDPPADDAQ